MYRGSFFPGRGTLVEENQLIGEAHGKVMDAADKVLHLLERRGVAVSDAERQRVLECGDLDVLNVWFDRAITAETTDAVFVEPFK
ncbi:hypothetical protein [Streptodolium elevatio]|uniref:Uncharacterized protein n=1 Tax=Streptodolium elevatio TaxID=3157996 RepID=A0ABV3DWH5_9ACTN